jgi:hypothetical protein
MARSTDDSDDRRKRCPKDDAGYEVLPDDDDEPHDAEYRRRRWGRDPDDQPDARKRRRKRHPFPWVVNLLGVVCAFSMLLTAPLTVAGLALFIAHPSKLTVAPPVGFGGLTVFFGRIAIGVWMRRASGDVLKQTAKIAIWIGSVTCIFLGPFTLRAFQDEKTLRTSHYMLAAVCASAVWVIGVGLLALFTHERLRQWARSR